jgi:hypothetical protein
LSRPTLLVATFVLVALALGTTARTPEAQTNASTYGACRPGEDAISAPALPETVELGRCPVEGRVIADNGVGTFLPPPGQSVYVESFTTEGSQELEVTRRRDGTVELGHVGDEVEEAQGEPEIAPAASGPGECSDRAFDNLDRRVEFPLRWSFNPNTTPDELSSKGALGAIRRGTANIADTHSGCSRGDRVPEDMVYEGRTNARAQVGTGGHCSGNDLKTVVSFGNLPQGSLAVACIITAVDEPYNRLKWSDIMINKADHSWTTNPGTRCRGKYDLESTVTHERGHTYGLGHVSESSHGNLTMSERSNGACQASERSLGRGDVLGLIRKYRNYP